LGFNVPSGLGRGKTKEVNVWKPVAMGQDRKVIVLLFVLVLDRFGFDYEDENDDEEEK
jgi:hypothetical protein